MFHMTPVRYEDMSEMKCVSLASVPDARCRVSNPSSHLNAYHLRAMSSLCEGVCVDMTGQYIFCRSSIIWLYVCTPLHTVLINVCSVGVVSLLRPVQVNFHLFLQSSMYLAINYLVESTHIAQRSSTDNQLMSKIVHT